MVTNQAAPTPIASVPAPTPSMSHSELATYVASTVSARCRQTSPAGANRLAKTTTTGTETSAAISAAASVQAPGRSRPRSPASPLAWADATPTGTLPPRLDYWVGAQA